MQSFKQLFLSCIVAGATCAACGSSDGQGDVTGAGGTGSPGLGGAGGVIGGGGGSTAVAQSGGAGGATPVGAGGATPPGSGGALIGGAPTTMGGTPGAGGSSAAGGVGNAGASGTGGTIGASGAGGAAGAAGASGAAGSAGSGGAGTDDPCAGGMMGPASDAGSKTRASGYGGIQFTTSTKTHITSLETTLVVPAKPTPGGTLFLWPGLEPLNGSANYNPIGTGVLQPVLTWGGTCAPNAPNNYADWWISAQYVNTLGSASGFTGCKGGPGMTVSVGDNLHILMTLNGTTWSQSVTDDKTGKNVSFDFDLKGQAQNWVIFSIEAPTGKQPVSDIVFTSTVVTTADSDPAACTPSVRGTNDYFSAPRSSADGLHCCVSKLILRGQGVPASGPNN